jgi:hypothetical protein
MLTDGSAVTNFMVCVSVLIIWIYLPGVGLIGSLTDQVTQRKAIE